jgi:hypothetical protein
MPFVDFAELKTRVSIEQAMQMLALSLTLHGAQYRGACPTCKTGGDRALIVTPAKGLFYCFAAKIGGEPLERRNGLMNSTKRTQPQKKLQ